MTKEIYYLDDALQGVDFDIKLLDFKYWFTGDETLLFGTINEI